MVISIFLLLFREMEEVGDFCHSCVVVVDEGIEEAGGVMQGDDIVVGYGSGDEGAIALA